MVERVATCRCGRLQAICSGEPVRVSVCHCLDCQKRSGSAFGAQARWADSDVEIRGGWKPRIRRADSGCIATYRFCANCGSTVAYSNEGWAGVVAVPLGAFADPDFLMPGYSVYEHRKHKWVVIEGEVKHSASPRRRCILPPFWGRGQRAFDHARLALRVPPNQPILKLAAVRFVDPAKSMEPFTPSDSIEPLAPSLVSAAAAS
jgi:hypothetical protein